MRPGRSGELNLLLCYLRKLALALVLVQSLRLAVCALIAIALVHSDNRLASILSMLLFATGVATAALLIAAHDRPFIGEISVSPDPLLQVMPQPEG